MPVWLEKINLNGVIRDMDEQHDLSRHEEPCPDEAREAMAKEVEKTSYLRHFAKRLRNAKTIAEVNRILECVYDEADRCRVWTNG